MSLDNDELKDFKSSIDTSFKAIADEYIKDIEPLMFFGNYDYVSEVISDIVYRSLAVREFFPKFIETYSKEDVENTLKHLDENCALLLRYAQDHAFYNSLNKSERNIVDLSLRIATNPNDFNAREELKLALFYAHKNGFQDYSNGEVDSFGDGMHKIFDTHCFQHSLPESLCRGIGKYRGGLSLLADNAVSDLVPEKIRSWAVVYDECLSEEDRLLSLLDSEKYQEAAQILQNALDSEYAKYFVKFVIDDVSDKSLEEMQQHISFDYLMIFEGEKQELMRQEHPEHFEKEDIEKE